MNKSFRNGLFAALVFTIALAVSSVAQLPATTGNFLGYLTSGVPGTGNAVAHGLPATQTGNATATLKMNGLGAAASACTITPKSSGKVVFTITGQLNQTVTADGVTWALAEGTGTAPANAATATGTIISAQQTWTALTGNLSTPFATVASVTGLGAGTAVWFDLQIADVTGGTASVSNVDCTANEL
jgi:hypothetical protein